MKCPICGGEMHADEVQSWMFGRLLVVKVKICKDPDCRAVVITDWLWWPQGATR